MAHPTNVKAAWTKPGFRVALVGAIDAATSTTMEHILLDTNTDAIWPHPSKELRTTASARTVHRFGPRRT